MSERSERAGAIATRLGDVLGSAVTDGPRQLSGGASQETWVFDTDDGRALVLQLLRPDRAGGDDHRPALLSAAASAGVSVAALVADGADDELLGSYVVVERLEGTADPAQILSGEDVPDAQALVDMLAAELAALHTMEVDGLPHVEDALEQLRNVHDGLGEPHPVFELVFRDLAEARPPAGRQTLVHGDFRMGNILVGREGISAVLDWELCHIGDPLQDLGWLCVRAWQFDRPDRPVAGLGSRESLLAAYARHSGYEVSPEALRWWELFGNLRWGVICVMQANIHLGGHAQSLEHAVIGRRACEVEWDLLDLLDPGGGARSVLVTKGAGRTLHDRPTAEELIGAIRGELGDHVLPDLEGRPAFRMRVALRALGTIGRQIAAASAHAELREKVLTDLGAPDEAILGGMIRAGDFDGRREKLLEGLRQLTHAKLEVANPRHLEPIPTEEKSDEPAS
jgi:aminoglycoside phosphotransferase (APT) family kinase protein